MHHRLIILALFPISVLSWCCDRSSPLEASDGLGIAAPVDGAGSASLSPGDGVVVGSDSTQAIQVRVGAGGIADGGAIRVWIPGMWGPPTTSQPEGANAVRVETTAADVLLESEAINRVPEPGGPVVDVLSDPVVVTVASGRLAEGDEIQIVYGDTASGGPGARAPYSSRENHTFVVETDADGDGTFEAIASSPSLDVVPDEPAVLRLRSRQTIAYVGETVQLEARLFDRFGNLATGYTGSPSLSAAVDTTATLSMVDSAPSFAVDQSIARTDVQLDSAGEVWFEAEDPTGQLEVVASNPIWVQPSVLDSLPEDALAYGPPTGTYNFWGDLHSHSDYSLDAYPDSRSAATMYPYMRDTSGLDFGAITDHDGNSLDETEWNDVKDANNDHNCDYDDYTNPVNNCTNDVYFVTLLAYEWTDGDGHKNVFFYRDGNYCESQAACDDANDDYDVIPFLNSDAAAYDTACEMWGAYVADYVGGSITDFDFFTVPHHPADNAALPNVDWSECPESCSPTSYSADYQPLVEMFSRHGNNEINGMLFPDEDPVGCLENTVDQVTVREALDVYGPSCKHHIGFIGSGDSHDGRPGNDPAAGDALDTCHDDPDGWSFRWYRTPEIGLVSAYTEGGSKGAAHTRQKIFDSLKDRYVYGTTGAQMLMWFAIEVDDGATTTEYHMGEDGIDVDQTDALEAQIKVLKDGSNIKKVELVWFDPSSAGWSICKTWNVNTANFDNDWDLDANCKGDAGEEAIYYVRAEQAPHYDEEFFVSDEVKWIDFKYGGTEYNAELDVGRYTASELATEITDEMEAEVNDTSAFTVTYDTVDQEFDFVCDLCPTNNFSLLWATGANAVTNAGADILLGFADEADLTLACSYSSDEAILSDGWTSREIAWSSPIWITW